MFVIIYLLFSKTLYLLNEFKYQLHFFKFKATENSVLLRYIFMEEDWLQMDYFATVNLKVNSTKKVRYKYIYH